MKKKNNKRTGFTDEAACMLHAEANKSDPFASRRMALVLRKGLDKADDVAKESLRLVNARRANELNVFADNNKLHELRARLIAINERKRNKQRSRIKLAA